MNKNIKILVLILLISVLLSASISSQILSDNETNGIILMIEEEKLARDVYFFLYQKWDIKTFFNIYQSEQTHMDAVKTLIDKYGIKNPVVNNDYGQFTNPELKKLYNDLIKAGSASIAEAYKTGLLIEELDISDLKKLYGETKNQTLLTVYQNLLKGSRNHLRAFYRSAKNYYIDYLPVFITKQEYNDIIKSPQEKGGY